MSDLVKAFTVGAVLVGAAAPPVVLAIMWFGVWLSPVGLPLGDIMLAFQDDDAGMVSTGLIVSGVLIAITIAACLTTFGLSARRRRPSAWTALRFALWAYGFSALACIPAWLAFSLASSRIVSPPSGGWIVSAVFASGLVVLLAVAAAALIIRLRDRGRQARTAGAVGPDNPVAAGRVR